MNILGINCFSHDTSACLLTDGRIAAFAEEERFVREKHTKRFPANAIDYCLSEGGVSLGDVEHVAFMYRPLLDYSRALRDFFLTFPFGTKRLAVQTAFDAILAYRAFNFKTKYGYKGDLVFVGHHDAHAASAYYPSGFDEAAVLSIDRGGDYLSTLMCRGKGDRLKRLKIIRNPHSVGALYTAVTEYLGFRANSGEGKVMGLAPYGNLDLLDEFRKIVKLEPAGEFKLDLSYFRWDATSIAVNDKFTRIFGPPREPEGELTARHENIARALQEVTEETALHLAAHLHEMTGSSRLCVGGGVGLNSVMNSRLARELPFEEVYIQPAANDAGTALGAPLWVHHMKLGLPRSCGVPHAYLGPGYTDQQIEDSIKKRKVAYARVGDPARYAAAALAAGKIVGWFQGRMEMGPRALGNRSILADPRGRDMKDRLNHEVKQREGFRPFAPSVLSEAGEDYFGGYRESPFMLLVLPVRQAVKSRIPAVVHVDGTGRLQTLNGSGDLCPDSYRRLVEEFRDLTGVPVVLNTSFNVRGEPIVMSPDDALNCFYATGIDTLVIGDFALEKP
jgi:carbamoyltransferase